MKVVKLITDEGVFVPRADIDATRGCKACALNHICTNCHMMCTIIGFRNHWERVSEITK